MVSDGHNLFLFLNKGLELEKKISNWGIENIF